MEEIVLLVLDNAVAAGYALIVTAWCALCVLFTVFAPVKWTEKVPDWIMVIINVSAGNVKNAVNSVTDIKGNPK